MNQALTATAVAVARALNAAYFVGTCAYCLLSYSSFAYAQFIKPQLVGWIPGAAATHHQWFWLTLLVTLPTLVPAFRDGSRRQRIAAGLYVAANIAVGLWLSVNPVLALTGPNTRTLALAVLCLIPPLGLALVDHLMAAKPALQRIEPARLFMPVAIASVVIWLAYAVLIPWYIPRTVGVELPWAAMGQSLFVSLVLHLLVFGAIYLVVMAGLALTSRVKPVQAEYWTIAALSVLALAFVFNRVVSAALSFRPAESWVLSGWLSVVLVAVWSGVAWRTASAANRKPAVDALDVWISPLAGRRRTAIIGLAVLPLIALGTRTAVAQLDWNFLIQKLGVSAVWALALGWTVVAIGRPGPAAGRLRRGTCVGLALAMVGIGMAGLPLASRLELSLDRYSAVDGSYQLLRGLLKTNSGADAEFYTFLRSHSTLGHVSASPVSIDFVDRFQPAAPPHVFLFAVDSLRRDYLSPYNPAVTFTPATQAFAGEAVVFDRAFTRYGATGLSMPALWAGGLLLHKQYVLPFAPMHALEKLLDGVGYRRLMSDDHLVTQLFRPSPATTLLDQAIQEMDHTMCATVAELQSAIDATATDRRPIFAMTRPLQLHTARLARDPATPASAYPGFVPGYAAQVAAFDRCLGGFVQYLKRTGLYDHSVVIVTSDHGESLGEDGRWGHAYTLYPEVVRIPLLIRVPPAMAVTANRSSVALSTDLTPTLYALAGQPPRDLGPLYGRPLFEPAGEAAIGRPDDLLLSSSYGPVHAMLRNNGQSLYVADAVQGRDFAFELRAGDRMERVTVTDAMRAANRRLMRDQIVQIAAAYKFSPAP
jgi:hypothetical protein